MKLRNKKTGKIKEWGYLTLENLYPDGKPKEGESYSSLAELNDEWEDCEPLLLDDLARKIIRLWAHNNKLKTVISYGNDAWIGLRGEDSQGNTWKIELYSMYILELENGKSYSIDDLCGAEE
jgi:hypothetical protein